MTDQPAPEGTPMPSAEPPPLAPLVEAAATPPPMPAAAPMPPVAPPPAVAWQAPAAVAPVTGGRTGLAAASGIILIVLGVLGALVGALFFAGTAMVGTLRDQIGEIPGLPAGTDATGIVAGVFIFFGVIILLYSLAYIFAGIGVLRSRGWGRVLGVVIGIISGLFWLAGMSGNGGTVVIILLAVHVYVFVTLAFFWRSKTA